jgi:hypothetical protein
MMCILRCAAILSAALFMSSTLGCLRAAPPPAPAARAPDPPPFAVTYRVARSVDGDGVLLAGRMDIGVHDDGRVEARAAHSAAAEKLQLTVRPELDGTLIARANYEERSADGATIQWAPSMRVARGAPARAEVTGSGWSRAIELTVQ